MRYETKSYSSCSLSDLVRRTVAIGRGGQTKNTRDRNESLIVEAGTRITKTEGKANREKKESGIESIRACNLVDSIAFTTNTTDQKSGLCEIHAEAECVSMDGRSSAGRGISLDAEF